MLLFGKSKKLSILAWGVIGIAVFAALSQVRHYYLNLGSDSARGVLTIASAYVAVDHFPFGTGWGTFGSAFSVEPYSPVYAMYNMHNVWGISESFPDFISDTFWPMILAQCGFIGFIIYIAVLLLVFKWILELRQKSSYVLASGLMIFAYLLIVTTGESAFVNPTAVPLAMWIGYLLGNSNAKSINNI